MTGDPTVSNAQVNMLAVAIMLTLAALCIFAVAEHAFKIWRARRQADLYWRAYDRAYQRRNTVK